MTKVAIGVLYSDRALKALGRDRGQCLDRVWTRQGGLVSRHGNGVATGDQSSLVATENLKRSVAIENFLT